MTNENFIGSTSAEPRKNPRGRPPGSKNKPKQTMDVRRETGTAASPVFLEILPGSDVISDLMNYVSNLNEGIVVVAAIGFVSYVSLCNPLPRAIALTLPEPVSLVSLRGWIVKPKEASSTSSASSSNVSPCSSSLNITLARRDGKLFGGIVAGKVIARSKVTVMVTTMSNSYFHEFPVEAVGGITIRSHSATPVLAASNSTAATPTPWRFQIPMGLALDSPARPPY